MKLQTASAQKVHRAKRGGRNREGLYSESSPFQAATKKKSDEEEYSLVTIIPLGRFGTADCSAARTYKVKSVYVSKSLVLAQIPFSSPATVLHEKRGKKRNPE